MTKEHMKMVIIMYATSIGSYLSNVFLFVAMSETAYKWPRGDSTWGPNVNKIYEKEKTCKLSN